MSSAKPEHDRDENDDSSSLDGELDLTSVFPTKKIKAQLRRDEGVGRVSKEAIEFINACSAIFVHDLAKEAAKVGKERALDPSSLPKNKSGNKPRGRKRKLDANKKESCQTITITLNDVQQCIENNKEQFDFLAGVTEGLSEAKAPGYTSSMRKKIRRQSNVGKSQVIIKPGKQTGLRGRNKPNVLEAAVGSVHEMDDCGVDSSITGDVSTLNQAIKDAQVPDAFVENILEDDDEYD